MWELQFSVLWIIPNWPMIKKMLSIGVPFGVDIINKMKQAVKLFGN